MKKQQESTDVRGVAWSDGLAIQVFNLEPVFPVWDTCCICGKDVAVKCFSPNYSIAMWEGLPVPANWTGEWAGFTACKECYDRNEAGELKTQSANAV